MPDLQTTKLRDPSKNQDWFDLAPQWQLRPDTIYLNHGSFTIPPDVVRYERRKWIDRLDEQPMDFYLRQLEPAMDEARFVVAQFVGTSKDNLVFVDNATYGMNVVAKGFPLSKGDEVLLCDHEYGSVIRTWQRKCDETGAKLAVAPMPNKFETHEQIVDALLGCITDRTKLLVVSHITSATALIMPIKKICQSFRERNIAVCVDGPHAPAQVELTIDDLDCDFYTASCHKWLCGSLGTGFLYANPRQHVSIQPPIKSWGRLLPAVPEKWDEEFTWIGTRDPSPFLSLPRAIEFMTSIGLENFRNRAYWLARYAEEQLCELFQTAPIGTRDQGWYGTMAHVPMPPGDWSSLQKRLWDEVGIEVMVISFKEHWYVRVSCHLYNNTTQIDTLLKALARMTAS
ncbi:MAG: aminotransferase class V-fold PLP-dependent enzyme [Mariniblastus sp.]